MYTGTLQDYQGIPDLIEAFEQVRGTNEDVELIFVGGGELEKYRQLVDESDLLGAVTFTGAKPFERMPEYLSLADIAVGPRRYGENLPSKLLTYMAAGVATVSTDIPGISTLFTDWENGVIVPREQPDELARALDSLLGDDTSRQNIARAGRETVVEEYSKEACGQRLVDLYHSLVDA
jgi:glycosyltransferase involved in cell wall biosynthesis